MMEQNLKKKPIKEPTIALAKAVAQNHQNNRNHQNRNKPSKEIPQTLSIYFPSFHIYHFTFLFII